MTQVEDSSRDMRLDPDSFAQGYFKNAVYRHWDPYAIEGLKADKEQMIETAPEEDEFDTLRKSIARFGAGEEAVTEDLMPLGLVLDDINDQMFLSSQIYEEAKHTQFFDRYWREVINPAEEALGFEETRPTDQRFFNDHYVALFDKTEDAMERLLDDDSPEARVKAYCHYHLVVESVLAQTGYYGFQSAFSDKGSDEVAVKDWPNADGLVTGVEKIRSDEGRHVGFGMNKVRGYVQSGEVDADVVQETLQDLMPHVAGTFSDLTVGINPAPLVAYSRDKLTRRIEIITDADAEVPEVDELVKLDTDEGAAAD
ncbi:ribonucleoside-diphosphate reductase [Halorientalis halophila]|uniref:ribonucleoside-diphosphate reductase n=1 Tax=Halorientalis halophila TaxID=3108499 RepID=UPI00300AAD81